MPDKPLTVAQYLASLPADRRATIEALRTVINANLDRDYEEGIQYGMLGYYVPHRIHPAGYHCDPSQPLPFAGLAAQKNYTSLYLMSVYSEHGDRDWFKKAWARTGKKLDMGKSCIRFQNIDDVALDVVAEAIRRMPAKRWIDICTRVAAERRPAKTPSTKAKATAPAAATATSKPDAKPAAKPVVAPAAKATKKPSAAVRTKASRAKPDTKQAGKVARSTRSTARS
jgi:hypothetical protein